MPEALPATGIKELAGLAQSFNKMAMQVQQLLANRATMLAGISHDLRTPLARMNLAIEMLPDNTNPDLVSRLRHDIESMNQLIGEFIALNRDDQHKSVEKIDVNRLLDWIVEDAGNKGANVIWRSGEQRFVMANAMLLRRTLENLLSNAIRYGLGKPVEVLLEAREDNVIVRILDSGPGIPRHEVENVFRPFYRLESSRSEATGGNGIGLAVVRQIADASGWRVELLERFGGGTDARLTIPVSRDLD
jgi:two-component system osmolarity sensor histidine kinase EnvZ